MTSQKREYRFILQKRLANVSLTKERRLLSCRSIDDVNSVHRRYERDVTALIDIQRLIDWASDHLIDIHFNPSVDCHYINKTVQIKSRLSSVTQLYHLMHELGHYMLRRSMKSYFRHFPYGYDSDVPRAETTNRHKIDVISEELAAWEKGVSLARRLGVTIDDVELNIRKYAALKTYFQWAASVDGFVKTTFS